ncbi:hypothetical protein N7G274_006333 [Stereocaulon virgatum]|uniref:Uncharacterized protein n=1 Tax=Stereocaulon virgatum TaxID=373712 RepID=A0ABR4A726_9LECA
MRCITVTKYLTPSPPRCTRNRDRAELAIPASLSLACGFIYLYHHISSVPSMLFCIHKVALARLFLNLVSSCPSITSVPIAFNKSKFSLISSTSPVTAAR